LVTDNENMPNDTWLKNQENYYYYQINWNLELQLSWIGIALGSGIGLFQTYSVDYDFISLASFSYIILVIVMIVGIDQIFSKIQIITECTIKLNDTRRKLYSEEIPNIKLSRYQKFLLNAEQENPKIILIIIYLIIFVFCFLLFLEKFDIFCINSYIN